MNLSFHLSKKFVDSYQNKPEPFGFNGLGAVTFYRTYSREKEDGTYESWADVCERVINGMYSIQKDYCLRTGASWSEEKANSSAMEAYDRLFNLKWTPPGRGLFTLGAPVIHERGLIEAAQNCAFVSTLDLDKDRGEVFRWFMEMLMMGVGVGFDTRGSGQFLITSPNHKDVDNYTIPDSREGWAQSVKILFESYTQPGYSIILGEQSPTIVFDYSHIRKAGEPIRGFGGTASGPEPLIKLHERMRNILDKNVGMPITTRTIVDIFNCIGACVVAGNVRRSSEIALGESYDESFLHLKNYEMNPDRAEWGWASNNSVFGYTGMNYDEIAQRIHDNGEPGIIWMENTNSYGRMNGIMDYRDMYAKGFNPCFAPRTLVQTKLGHFYIEDLVGREVDIWNGESWQTVNNFRITATHQDIIKIVLQDGSEIRCTPYHMFLLQDGTRIIADELMIGDKLKISDTPITHGKIKTNGAYIKGFLIGDGTHKREQQAVLWVYGDKIVCEDRLKKSALEIVPIVNTNAVEDITFRYNEVRDFYNMTGLGCRSHELLLWTTLYKNGLPPEVFEWDLQSKAEFIAGLFDADGTVKTSDTHGFGYQLSSVNKQLLLDVQSLLKTIGVRSKLSIMHQSGKTDFNDGYGEYQTKTSWRLDISQENSIRLSNIVKFERLMDFSDKTTKYAMTPRFNTIVSIEYDGVESEVYCCTVEGNHQFSLTCGIDVGNCAEQPLESYECCTLVELYPDRHSDLYDFQRSVKFAYLYGKTITLLSDQIKHPQTKEVMMRNRRIGLSMTGIVQFITRNGIDELKTWTNEAYDYVTHYDKRYSSWLNVPRSNRMTTVKPSGTVSLLAGATPGVHFPRSEFYIRRIRISILSPMVAVLKDAGFHVEDDYYSDNTVVVEFPVHVGDNIRSVLDVSIWEQLALAAFMQENWSDNSVSVTISFDPAKVSAEDISHALSFYQYKLKSVSMLPEPEGGAYKQMPYEEITREQYEQMVAKIDFSVIGRLKDAMGGAAKLEDKYCNSDVCEIKFETPIIAA